MSLDPWSSLLWVLVACALGFATTAVFSGWLKLPRNLFLIPYVALSSIFLICFFVMNTIDVAAILSANWIWGTVAGVLIAVFLVFNVRSQPASRESRGSRLALEITWTGLVYGLVDAVFLSVMPVVAIWAGTAGLSWAASVPGKLAVGAIGLLASLAVSVTYHLGYAEFQGSRIKFAIIGPGIITLGFLVSGNPLGSIISHPIMHVAAVLRGPESTIQLPPHREPVPVRAR
jgi:hypothetical protein